MSSNHPAPDLFYHMIGRCAGCFQKECPHPKIKQTNPMGHCSSWTDGNPTKDPYEVFVTKNAYNVDSDEVKLNCTAGCRKGLPRKRDYPIVFI